MIACAGLLRRQALNFSPLFRVNQAIYLFTSRAMKSICNNITGEERKSVTNVSSDTDHQKLEKRNNFPQKVVLEIIDIIKKNEKDLESRLSNGASRLSVYSITEVFELLNSQKISGSRFIEWIWSNNPQMHKNTRICSLMIDNFGRLNDYRTMFSLMKKLSSKNIFLTYEAFGFLLGPTDSSLKDSTKRVVDLLNKVGGSFRNSGICALVEMFCKVDLFDTARYIIEITEKKESYYCLLIREKCGRGLTEDARGTIQEMVNSGCTPSTKMYNCILGSLYKHGTIDEALGVVDEMNGVSIPPDAITFEILILFVCKINKFCEVHQLLDQMVAREIEPRLSTHAVIVKAFFSAEKYEEAYKYVVDSSIIHKASSNMMYGLIASLYREKGNIFGSCNILFEMMEKGLKPNCSVYNKVVRQLKATGRRNLARDLERRYSKFVFECRTRNS